MVTIYEYYDKKKLEETILLCIGGVYLPLEDGGELNIKEDRQALQILLKTGIGKDGLRLRVTTQTDLISFIWLSLQAA